jgi:hypothetical protein
MPPMVIAIQPKRIFYPKFLKSYTFEDKKLPGYPWMNDLQLNKTCYNHSSIWCFIATCNQSVTPPSCIA